MYNSTHIFLKNAVDSAQNPQISVFEHICDKMSTFKDTAYGSSNLCDVVYSLFNFSD